MGSVTWIRIAGRARWRIVPAEVVAPGLAVARLSRGFYSVTHLASGMKIGPAGTRRHTMRWAMHLASAPDVDWTASTEVLRADALLGDLVDQRWRSRPRLTRRRRRADRKEALRQARVAWRKADEVASAFKLRLAGMTDEEVAAFFGLDDLAEDGGAPCA